MPVPVPTSVSLVVPVAVPVDVPVPVVVVPVVESTRFPVASNRSEQEPDLPPVLLLHTTAPPALLSTKSQSDCSRSVQSPVLDTSVWFSRSTPP